MALIKCSGCGNEISDKAVKCPKCGMICGTSCSTNTKENIKKKIGAIEIISIIILGVYSLYHIYSYGKYFINTIDDFYRLKYVAEAALYFTCKLSFCATLWCILLFYIFKTKLWRILTKIILSFSICSYFLIMLFNVITELTIGNYISYLLDFFLQYAIIIVIYLIVVESKKD